MSGLMKNSNFDGIDKTTIADIAQHQDRVDRLVEEIDPSRRAFLERLFPDKRQRAIVAGQIQDIKDNFEARRQCLLIARETQLRSLTENCNQYLIRIKAKVRGETFEELMNASLRLQQEAQDAFEKFIQTQDKAMESAKSINNKRLREILEKSIDKDTDLFLELRTTLLEKFYNIIEEEIKIQKLGGR
jgi:hypothetical protein